MWNTKADGDSIYFYRKLDGDVIFDTCKAQECMLLVYMYTHGSIGPYCIKHTSTSFLVLTLYTCTCRLHMNTSLSTYHIHVGHHLIDCTHTCVAYINQVLFVSSVFC